MRLSPESWQARADAHATRVDRWIQPHLERRLRGEKHPVHDFMFTYYSQRPSQLRTWHPGWGVELLDRPDEGARLAAVDAALGERQQLLRQLHKLLTSTASRPPTLGCFGLHEWAMVYRAADHSVRHDWPLRLGGSGTDEVVESHRIGCSHFDAFRFFTPDARPLNTLQPGRDDRADFEQPGCLHATMDLYKHAFRLSPLIESELVADCFALAWDVRILDMRAAPYDFTGMVLDPTGEPWSAVPIETAEGKSAYVAAQRDFANRAAPLRRRLIDECARLLAAGQDL